MMPRLILESQDGKWRITIEQGQVLRVGRSPPSDVLLEDPSVGRKHARLSYLGEQCTVEDDRSPSGTLWNGRIIHDPHPIQPGDEIRIGAVRFFVREPGKK